MIGLALLAGAGLALAVCFGLYLNARSRGRSGWAWLALVVFLPGLGITLFVVVALSDYLLGAPRELNRKHSPVQPR